MTVSPIVRGDAPGYWPLTTTVGGTTCGNSLIGSSGNATNPATTMMIESTDAKIGRSMKNDEMLMARSWRVARHGRRRRQAGPHRDMLRRDRSSRPHSQQTVDDDNLAGLQSLANDAQPLE